MSGPSHRPSPSVDVEICTEYHPHSTTLLNIRLSHALTWSNPMSLPDPHFINWGRTFACEPLAIFEPESVLHCQRILDLARHQRKVVRAVGVGHSPSDLACTSGYMLRTTKLNRLLEVGRSRTCQTSHQTPSRRSTSRNATSSQRPASPSTPCMPSLPSTVLP